MQGGQRRESQERERESKRREKVQLPRVQSEGSTSLQRGWGPCPMLHTATSTSVVRVGKHEQITRLLIAVRSEEVSTFCLPCLSLRFSNKPLPGRNRLSPQSQLLSLCACVCVGALSQQLFHIIEPQKPTTSCWNLLNPHSMLHQQLPCKPLKYAQW